jgi:hypothetical protein
MKSAGKVFRALRAISRETFFASQLEVLLLPPELALSRAKQKKGI